MTYEEAREFIKQSNRYGIKPGLETICELLARLGNPQEHLKVIHIAGTNGKGSTSAFITTVLGAAGYRVGRFLSPAVFSYREGIQIAQRRKGEQEGNNGNKNNAYINNNHSINEESLDKEADDCFDFDYPDKDSIGIEYISESGVCEAMERIQPICEAMLKEGLSHPTSFEIETAMAMLYFIQKQVDFVVLEVGLGGRLDATNIVKQPVLSIITSISMDHMQYLGDTLDKIAYEKAGIIKHNVPAVTCQQEATVLNILEEVCREKETQLSISEFDRVTQVSYTSEETIFTFREAEGHERYKIKLLGDYQVSNAVLAIQAIKILRSKGYYISEAALKWGLYETRWSGRFEIIAKNPYLVIDGAHNEEAANVLRRSIDLYFTNRRIIYMIGVLADKDYKSILRITAPLADMMITLTPNNPRALASSELAKEALALGKRVIDAGNTREALRFAFQEAGVEDVIIAFGSLSFLGELVNLLGVRKDDETYDR
ncbi:MAG: hypothetical protein K0S76_1330 [Herbinix sp.]|nr:hypothetical protein [Herbinix sp.]